MYQITLTIKAEFESLHDALADLERAYGALRSRHGDRFRELERRIEQLADGDAEISVESIGGGTFVPVSAKLSGILADARKMGVI